MSRGTDPHPRCITCLVLLSLGGWSPVLREFLRLPPLSYTDAELDEMNIQGHSGHATMPEWGSIGGVRPMLPGVTLEPEIAIGFDESDIDALGNWLRNAASSSLK